MAVSLKKGGNVSLEKEAGHELNAIMAGLGWDEKVGNTGFDFDLDASAFLLESSGKVRNDEDFIFYRNLNNSNNSVVHQGDNLTGKGEGDDEQIFIDLKKLPSYIQKIAIVVTIHEAKKRGQNFGQVQNAFIRIVDFSNDREIVRYDLSEDYSMETAMIFGELYLHNNVWKFKAIGQGFNDGLRGLALNYGVDVE